MDCEALCALLITQNLAKAFDDKNELSISMKKIDKVELMEKQRV